MIQKQNKQSVSELTWKEFKEFIDKGLVLIDFTADWCMPCIIMAPVIEELAKTFKGKIKFGKIDVDENREISEKFRIFSIPNFILFKDGEVKDRFIGALSKEDFVEKLKKHL